MSAVGGINQKPSPYGRIAVNHGHGPPRIRGRGAAAHRRPQADQEIRGLHGSA